MADSTEKKTGGARNPYYEKLTEEVTVRLSKDAIKYFEGLAKEKQVSFNRIVDIYLCECMENKREPHFPWEDKCS